MSIEEVIQKLQEAVNLGDSPNRGPFGTHIRKEYLVEAIDLLKTHPEAKPSELLTLEELREMKWEPAWVDGSCEMELGGKKGWAILYHEPVNKYVCVWWPGEEYADIPSLDYYGDTWKAYRRPPKED